VKFVLGLQFARARLRLFSRALHRSAGKSETLMIRPITFSFAAFLLAAATLDAEAAASLTLSKTSGPPTTAITVKLKGFAPAKLVDVFVDSTDACVLITSATGAGTCSLKVPDAAQPGTHWITAAVRATGSGLQKSFLVRTDWPEHHGLDVSHDGFNRYENTISTKNAQLLEAAWSAPGTTSIGSAVVAAGKVYIGSIDGKLHAFDAVTGAKIAGFPLTLGPAIQYASPVVAGGIVYIASFNGSASTIHARNATTGVSVGGSFPVVLSAEARGTPIVVAGKLFIGASDGKLYGLDAKTGAALANFPVTVGASAIRGTPAYGGGVVYFGDMGGGLHGYDLTGTSQFNTSVAGAFDVASPAVTHQTVYYGSNVEHKLRATTTWGGTPWSAPFTMASFWDGTPAVAGGRIFVADGSGALYAVDATTGTASWSTQLGSTNALGSATVANGVVFTANVVGTHAVDASNGKLLWSYGIGQTYGQSIAVVNGTVYVPSYNGNLTAFRIKGAAPDAATAAPAIAGLKPDLSLKSH